MDAVMSDIFDIILACGDLKAIEDLYHLCQTCRQWDSTEEERKVGLKWLRKLNWYLLDHVGGYGDGKDMSVAYDLHKRILREAAPDDFDSFMLYLEWNRDADKKFYVPRRKQLMPIVEALQKLEDDELDLVTISLPPGVGKLLSDDTPVMTPLGWKCHGDLKVGDYVVGIDGKYKRVERVYPKDVANYAVTFTNGEVIKCHENHEWVIYNRHRNKQEIMTVKDMLKAPIEYGEQGKRGHRYYYQLPQCEPMVGDEIDFAVDPYTLGVWLGDGSASNPRITICDTDKVIVDSILEHTKYKISSVQHQVGSTHYSLSGLREDLQQYSMCFSHDTIDKNDKYLPDEYLNGSYEQRMELLAGLIDTDGTVTNNGRKCSFTNTNMLLMDGVCQLISTFGWRYYVTVQKPIVSTSGVVGKKMIYTVMFCPDKEIPTRVPRKRVHPMEKCRRIAIQSIEVIDPVPGNCIQVEGGVYRVGLTMLPTHNSTTAIFYLSWLAGRHPDKPMLGGSHSNSFIRGVYDECLRVLGGNGGEYLWSDVFPGVQISNTNAKDCRIDLGTRKRFETLQFTSIGSGNAGLYRAEQILYCDDLVDGLETALSRERLDKLWGQYTTDLRQRKIGKCKELHIATRWSVHDIIGRLEEQYGDSERALFLKFPALDDEDESNFDYPCSAGFSTEFYRTQRDIMDEISWKALYMNSPIERDGQLYSADELRRYFELPDEEPDAIIAVCDTKDKGKDYCVLPVAYQYGQNFYIEDVICDNGKPEIVEERLVQILLKHGVHMACFESNSAGGKIAEKVQDGVKGKGGKTKITTKYTTANKETKIIVEAPYVKEHFLFKDDSVLKGQKEYRRMLEQLTGYTMMGKNAHDDTPDAMAQLSQYIQSFALSKVQVFRRPW